MPPAEATQSDVMGDAAAKNALKRKREATKPDPPRADADSRPKDGTTAAAAPPAAKGTPPLALPAPKGVAPAALPAPKGAAPAANQPAAAAMQPQAVRTARSFPELMMLPERPGANGLYHYEGESRLDLIDFATLHAERTADRLIRNGWEHDTLLHGVTETVSAAVERFALAQGGIGLRRRIAIVHGAVRVALTHRGFTDCYFPNNPDPDCD
jgi:hypothetical protein